MQAAMATTKPKITAILEESLMQEIKQLAEDEYRSLSQMAAVLIREAVEARKIAKPINESREQSNE